MLGAIAFGIAIVALGALILEYWKFAVSIGILCVMTYFIYDRAVHSVIPLTDLNIYDITGNCDYRPSLAYCSLKATVTNTSPYYLDSITVRIRVTDCQKGTSTCVNLDLDSHCAYFYTREKDTSVNVGSRQIGKYSEYFDFKHLPSTDELKGEFCSTYEILGTTASLFR